MEAWIQKSMNIILANVRSNNPAVHRANGDGKPMCGAVHSDVIPYISMLEMRKHHKYMEACNDAAKLAEGQAELKLKDPRIPKKVLAPMTVMKIKPKEEYVQDIGAVTCKACVKLMEKEVAHA